MFGDLVLLCGCKINESNLSHLYALSFCITFLLPDAKYPLSATFVLLCEWSYWSSICYGTQKKVASLGHVMIMIPQQ